MAHFTFTALDSKGKEVHGEIEADSQQAAVARIRERQYFPTKIEEASGGAAPARKGAAKKGALQMEIKMPKFLQGGVKAKQLTTFTRQLSTLINAGLPLLRALRGQPILVLSDIPDSAALQLGGDGKNRAIVAGAGCRKDDGLGIGQLDLGHGVVSVLGAATTAALLRPQAALGARLELWLWWMVRWRVRLP